VTELQQNRYDQLLRRVGDLKGPGSKVNDVLQELFPTIDVENVPGELLLLMGTRIGFAGTSKAPTAGKKAGIQLFNPVGSGHLVTISTILMGKDDSGSLSWGQTTLALGTNTGIARIRDTRVGTSTDGVSQLRTAADAGTPVGGILLSLTSRTFNLTDPNAVAVLAPGTGLTVTAITDALLNVTFYYRERVAEPSELSF